MLCTCRLVSRCCKQNKNMCKDAYHLNAENFMLSHMTFPSPPRRTLSQHIGQTPTFSRPRPFTNRGVYKSRASLGGLKIAPAWRGRTGLQHA